MKTILLAMAASMTLLEAKACPELDSLTKRYGISFAGFDKPIPAVKGPGVSDTGRLVRLPLAYPEIVSDGFRHMVLFDTAARQAWILRTGGFAGVRQWYGPVEVGDARLENCRPRSDLAGAERIVAPNRTS